jgi:hypothetical protein
MAWYLKPEIWNVALAAVAIALSLYAIVEGKRSSRRSGVIELHGAWSEINELNPNSLSGPTSRQQPKHSTSRQPCGIIT